MSMIYKVLILLSLLSAVFLSGCLNPESTEKVFNKPEPEVKYVYVTPELTVQEETIVSGQNGDREVSGRVIIVSGQNNDVKILNSDVYKIVIYGQNNDVYYPQNSNPVIDISGQNNDVHKY